MCSDMRQEFILLSDVLGVTMLVDAINHRKASSGVTESTVLGPFYVEGPPEAEMGAAIDWNVEGEPFFVEGTIRSEDGEPLADVIVDVWQSDSEGFYDVQKETGRVPHFAPGSAPVPDGRYRFWTVTPSPYPIPTDGPVGQLLAKAGASSLPTGPCAFHVAERRPSSAWSRRSLRKAIPTSTAMRCSE